ncbi:polyprotein [Glycine max]|nr:polyprotein [Glycine max]
MRERGGAFALPQMGGLFAKLVKAIARFFINVLCSFSFHRQHQLPCALWGPLREREERITRPKRSPQKDNLFEDINQNMDDWNIPEIPQDQLHVPETIKDKHNFDYIIKTVENNIPLGQDIGEEFHLLSKNSIYEHSRKYKYLHIGCVQVAIKPLIDMGIDAAVLMCLRDIRHNQFEDSLIGTVETSLGQGPIYFNCYPNKTVSLMDRNILDSLFLNIHFHGLDMNEGSIPVALIYRIQYKVMNTCASRVLLKPQKGETTLFITDMTKANVSLPRKIKCDEVTLPERWVMDKATPSIPRPAPTIEHIKQDNSGKVEITFNRRNSFSSRIEASRSEYESARRSFSAKTRSIPVGLTRSELHNQFLTVNLQGINTTSSIPRTTYNQEQEDDQKSIQSPTYSSMEPYDETLRKDFYSPENEPQRRWFFQHYKGTNRKQIQDKFYEFVERVKINVLFFDWFHAYAIRKDIDYPWKQDIIGDPTTNVITNWQVKDGELIQSELPPATQYQLPNIKDSNNKPVMAIPFKTKDVNEEVTSKDIKSLMEQANYTNKYLQALGETIKTKVVPKQKSIEEASPSIPIEKPLFKPFKVSEKAKRKIRELRKTRSLIEGVGDNHSELLNKIGSLLKVIPDTPQASENTSKMVTRSTSKLINVINEDSDQNSDNTTEIGSVSEKNINPINSKHWKTPSKLYYQRPTAPDLLLEERGENNFKSFSANNIYEWNIDAQTEYNIMNTLQHMTMVAMTYQTSHECSEETIIDILVAGFSGQLKGWWDNYLTNEEKSKIYSAVKTDLNGKVITNDDDKEIPDAVNTLIFTIAQHFIGDPSLWKDRSAELLSNLKCRTLAYFRWYRDTFLTRVYTREDSQQPFWKEKFLAGLPRSLGDKVRDKIRSQSANGDIPYESLSYGQLISYVQKVVLKICQDDKIQRQLAKEKAQTKKDLGSFCEQFGLPACPKQKKKQSSRKEIHENKPIPRRRYSHKPSTSREIENPRQKTKSKITCYNCGKQCNINKYCRLKKKLRNLNLEPAIEEQINNLLIETSEEETETSSSEPSDENLNLIQQDDQLSSTDEDDGQINTLTREQDLLFEAINSIHDPLGKEEVKPRQKDFITNNKFDVSNILKRLENSSTKPTTIQDLQTEINNLKREVKELRQQQEIHQIILSQLEEDSDSESANNSEENQPENLEDDMFMGLINKIKIQKFYINIKIIINDFVLETMALFDTGADSNCILEGLIPTKFFEKTSEKLSTANGSKLKINFKLSNAIIENQGLRINTNFLLVKNLKNEVILGTPFIRALFPIQISSEGITTNYLGRKIIFNFSTKPISRNINLKENKINQINFLKEEVSFNNIQIQLGKPQVKEKIQSLLNHIESTVSSSSDRGGRSSTKGKEVLLALPEPITKKATTTSSGSPTQTGSSTQKGKIEGSLTQITTAKPKSSTQESPKPTTTKQTVADYAWSIQTLLALEDIGLTKIPKLAKKTWAEMASESDDDSETDLQKQIQKAKQTKTVYNQRPSQSLTQQESTSQPSNSYISKNKFFNVLQMEPEYWDKNPFKATAKVFPPGFHYRPIATNKTRKFYEFILIDTNSVSIKHFKDPKDPNLNTHSTIQILKVMQPRHYGSNLNQPKKFSAPFDPAGYNYWDYIDAWTNVFWHQNSKFKHSWLIYFKNNTVYNFPNWFLQWWNYFGPIPQIFPEEVQQGFQQFNKLYNSKESRIPADLKYFSSFALSWIFS